MKFLYTKLEIYQNSALSWNICSRKKKKIKILVVHVHVQTIYPYNGLRL